MSNGTTTLLSMTQNILSAMDSDDVNSISDTEESWQVATCVQETYFDLFANRLIPENQTLLALTPGTDPDIPTWLIIPEGYNTIDFIQYDTLSLNQTSDPPPSALIPGCYQDVKYLTPKEFLWHTNVLQVGQQPNTTSITIPIPNAGTLTYAIFTNTAPSYWTSFDDQNLYFDAYNSIVETTLTAEHCLAWGQQELVFPMEDTAVPNLDQNLFPTLLAEAKSVCFNNFKQSPNAKEEQRSKRGQQRSQKFLWKANQRQRANSGTGYDMPNYSRVCK